MYSGLDSIDIKILTRLQEDARVSNVELADAVGLSPSPCLRRVRELERRGVIRHYVALLDPEAVGLPVSVFVNVTLERQVEDALKIFKAAIERQPEVLECYLMTGEADYLLRVVTADVAAYQRFLIDHLIRIPVVANIKSSFALTQVKYRTALPLDEGRAVPDAPPRPAPPAPQGRIEARPSSRRSRRQATGRRRPPASHATK